MTHFNFIQFSDKFFYVRFLLLILFLWIAYGIISYIKMPIDHLETLMFFFTLIPAALMVRRLLISYDGKAKTISLTKKRITFDFALSRKQSTYKRDQIKSIYIKDFFKRKTFFSDPFQYFLTFEFNDGNSIESTEITSSKAGKFMEAFENFAQSNKLNLPVDLPESLFSYIEDDNQAHKEENSN